MLTESGKQKGNVNSNEVNVASGKSMSKWKVGINCGKSLLTMLTAECHAMVVEAERKC
jgi:hypothetical protein